MSQPDPHQAQVYREMIAHIDRVMAMDRRSAALHIHGSNGESHMIRLWEPAWLTVLANMREDLAESIGAEDGPTELQPTGSGS